MVLLIDEIDKADMEFPNDLLHEIDRLNDRKPHFLSQLLVILAECRGDVNDAGEVNLYYDGSLDSLFLGLNEQTEKIVGMGQDDGYIYLADATGARISRFKGRAAERSVFQTRPPPAPRAGPESAGLPPQRDAGWGALGTKNVAIHH